MRPEVLYLSKFTYLNCKTEEMSPNMLSLSIYVVYLIFVYVHKRLGSVSPTVVNFNRRFAPHFNLQLACIRFTNAS